MAVYTLGFTLGFRPAAAWSEVAGVTQSIGDCGSEGGSSGFLAQVAVAVVVLVLVVADVASDAG